MKCGPDELSHEIDLIKRFGLLTFSDSVQNQFVLELEDPLVCITSGLSNASFVNFSRSCRQTLQWTKQERERRASSHLLELVAHGNQEAAKRMLQSDLSLLFTPLGRVTDYTGKVTQGLTAFQAALCADDAEMCEMMKVHFDKLEYGYDSLKKQYDSIFPQGIELIRQEQLKGSFDFSEIVNAILNAPEDDVRAAINKKFNNEKPLHNALSAFRKAFDTRAHQSQIFNPYHMVKAFQIFSNLSVPVHSENKCELIWRQVVGYVQRHLPSCYAQVFAQSLFHFIEEEELFVRSFEFRHCDGAIFPLKELHDLGFDFAVGSSPSRATKPHLILPCSNLFETLIRAKISRLGSLVQLPIHTDRFLPLSSPYK